METIGSPVADNEGRVCALEFPSYWLVCAYVPNAQPGLKRIETRLAWDASFRAFLAGLTAEKPIVTCGDFNVAHEEIDLRNPDANRGNPGFSDEERGSFEKLLDAGFVSEQEKHEAMAGATAFLPPSVNESFGIVLLEAFLARTPGLVHAKSRVLVSQCRAANAGLWFRHYPDFEAQLLYLLDNPQARAALGARGRDFVAREYAWPAIERKFFEALDALRPRAG